MVNNGMVRSESRRRLPDPPSGVEPVTLQGQIPGQFSQNESVQLEQRMQGFYQNRCHNRQKILAQETKNKTPRAT